MDFFRKAADAVGGLILDSDSDSESERGGAAAGRAGRRTAAEKNDKTPMDDHWTDGGMDLGADARGASGSDDGAPPEGADGSFETSDDEGDEKLIPDAVWGALAAARGKISEVASTVRADVASAVEVVRHDLSEFNDRAVDETAAFAGDVAAAEYSAGLGLDANLGDDGDDDDTAGDDGPRLDPDVARAFDATVDALDDVGHRVEDFGVRVLGASKRFFKNLKEELALDDEDDDEDDEDDGGGFTSRVGLGAGAAAAAGAGLAAKFASDRASSKPRAGSSNAANPNPNPNPGRPKPQTLEQRVAAMQRDSATYCDEPEDLAGFERWTSGFDADSPTVVDEIESVLEGNAFMAELQARIVPLVVTREEFWQRYFYALRRIKLEFGVEKEEEDEKDEKQEEKKEEEKEEKKKKEEEKKEKKKKEEEKKEEDEEEKKEEEQEEKKKEKEEDEEGGKQIESENAEEAPEAHFETAKPPAHPRVAAVSAADSADESGVTSDGSWTKVQSDGEIVEKEAATAEGRMKGADDSAPAEKTGREKEAVAPPVAKEPAAADDEIDEDWGMDSD